MELVNGVTLKDIRKKRGPLPVTEAIAYTLGILPSFEFLHSKHIIYCDFKMDNAMVQHDRIRLIDLGGARQENDMDSDLFLTMGYCAPEAEHTVSYTSDLFTVGRTLAILLLDFDFRGVHKFTLPTPQEVDIFGQYESLYRFLLRATAQKPDDRFQSAEEMSSQLEGVLREIVSLDSKSSKPSESLWFGMDMHSDGDAVTHDSLPVIKVDKEDPAKGLVESAMQLNEASRQKQLFENALRQFPQSTEAPLRLANVCIDMGDHNMAKVVLDKMAKEDPFDWRIAWSRGRQRLAQKQFKEAYPFFDAVYSELPGELAPKLGLAMAAELVSDFDSAIRLYDLVSTVDPNYTTAAFGLARCMAAAKDRRAAVEAYARVPNLSIAFVPSRLRQVRTLIQGKPAEPGKKDLVDAADTLQSLHLDGFERYRLEADIFLKAIWLLDNGRLQVDATANLMGQPINNVDKLRERAEAALRSCAKFAHSKDEVLKLIDEANSVRPRTMF
jgi:serine/threonine-protein kinase PknG